MENNDLKELAEKCQKLIAYAEKLLECCRYDLETAQKERLELNDKCAVLDNIISAVNELNNKKSGGTAE